METSLSVPQVGQLEAFWNRMEQNGRESQAEDIRQILSYVKAMQTDLADALDEVAYLRDYIQDLENASIKNRLGKIQKEIQQSLCYAGNQLKEVEMEVTGEIQNTMDALKSKGIQVLDQILNVTHVSQGLSRAESFLMQAAAGMERKLEAIDCMAEEIHAIKGHAKNVGRAAVGRPAEEITARDVTKGVLAKLRAGMEFCRKILAGMGRKALMARAHAAHLHQMAEQKTEKISSVQEIAGELQAVSAMNFNRQPEQSRS